MKELVLASNNKHKLAEIRDIVGKKIQILSLDDIGFHEEIIEDATTIEGNAIIKANCITNRFGRNCFADDTGLEVDALNGAPGVYSARYAGEHCSFQDNVDKLLKALQGTKNRKARFRTVIALNIDGKQYLFEGCVEGNIIEEQHGVGGFGYDPIFQPEGYSQTFAEMPEELKNSISHRGKATAKLVSFLEQLNH